MPTLKSSGPLDEKVYRDSVELVLKERLRRGPPSQPSMPNKSLQYRQTGPL